VRCHFISGFQAPTCFENAWVAIVSVSRSSNAAPRVVVTSQVRRRGYPAYGDVDQKFPQNPKIAWGIVNMGRHSTHHKRCWRMVLFKYLTRSRTRQLDTKPVPWIVPNSIADLTVSESIEASQGGCRQAHPMLLFLCRYGQLFGCVATGTLSHSFAYALDDSDGWNSKASCPLSFPITLLATLHHVGGGAIQAREGLYQRGRQDHPGSSRDRESLWSTFLGCWILLTTA